MLEKDKMRKADVYSGALVFLFGLWVVGQAFKMPMRDSWGGVMNVWYVSPALMPIFIGGVIMLLGVILCRAGLKAIGFAAFKDSLRWMVSPDLIRLLKSDIVMRFYAVVVLFATLVYINLPRVDFFLCAILFMTAFITLFYFLDDALMRKLLRFYLLGEVVILVLCALGLHRSVEDTPSYVVDTAVLLFIVAYLVYVRAQVRPRADLKRKFRVGLIVALVTPFVVGPIFKYFLMVPLPKEGLVVAALDYVWYLEFL
jgi:hypothetical protein